MQQDHRREPAVRAARRLARRGAGAVPLARREVQGRDHRIDPGGGRGLVLPARRLHRPLPRAARRAHGRHQGVQGAVVRRRLLARRRAQPAAPARLRHGVPLAGGARRVPAPDRGGEEARPPDAGARAGPLLVRRAGRPGLRALAPQGGDASARSSRISIRREVLRRGYQPVYTPHVAREQLLETSGHLAHYNENLFGGMELEGQRYLVKPMNCPFHIAIYRSQMRSYRDLPIRYSELGTVYRYERSGVLHGLLRVRGFTQDDGHLFVREDQIADEMRGCVQLRARHPRPVRLQGHQALPVDPPGELHGRAGAVGQRRGGDPRRRWRRPAGRSRWTRGAGRSTGPKIDLKIRDALGREWQCGDLPARLPAPRALRPRVRRRRTARASGRS